MRWLISLLWFSGGVMFGMFLMALMVASSRAERLEVMTDAGRSREQDSEPGDQHDEADRTYYCLGSPGISETQKECGGGEV